MHAQELESDRSQGDVGTKPVPGFFLNSPGTPPSLS